MHRTENHTHLCMMGNKKQEKIKKKIPEAHVSGIFCAGDSKKSSGKYCVLEKRKREQKELDLTLIFMDATLEK